MKRLLIIILTISLMLSLVACGDKPEKEDAPAEYVQELVCIRQQQRLYAQAIDGSEPRLIKDMQCWAYKRSGDILIAQFDDSNVYMIDLRNRTEEILFSEEVSISQLEFFDGGFIYSIYSMTEASEVYKYEYATKKSTKLFEDWSFYEYVIDGSTMFYQTSMEIDGQWEFVLIGYDIAGAKELWMQKTENASGLMFKNGNVYVWAGADNPSWNIVNTADGTLTKTTDIGYEPNRTSLVYSGSKASLIQRYDMDPETQTGQWNAYIMRDGESSETDLIEGFDYLYCVDSEGDLGLIRSYLNLSTSIFDEEVYTSAGKYYFFNGEDGTYTELTAKDNIQKMFADVKFPVFDCSTARKPVVSSVYRLFCTDAGNEGNAPVCNTTHLAWLAIADGTSDIALLAAPTDEEKAYLKEKNVSVDMKLYGGDGLVFIANKACGVSDLSLDDIKAIYSGEITNWKELGGVDHEITVLYRDDQSGSQRLFERLVWNNENIPDFASLGFMQSDFMSDIVWDCVNFPYAVGYSIMTYLNDVFAEDSLLCFTIDGVEAVPENISNGSYLFGTKGYVVIRSDEPEGSGARILYDWFGSKMSDEILTYNGITPLHE